MLNDVIYENAENQEQTKKHITAKAVNLIAMPLLAIAFVTLLAGCTTAVEKRILNTSPVSTGVPDLHKEYEPNLFRYCVGNDAVGNSDVGENSVGQKHHLVSITGSDSCFHYYDFADFLVEHDGETITRPSNKFTFTNTSETQDSDTTNSQTTATENNRRRPTLSETVEYRFPELPDNAPIVVIVPGYGLEAPHMVTPWADWFRSMGLHPIILPGPNEYPPMQFGLNYPPLVSNMLVTKYPDRPIVLFGFSMGAISALAIEQELLAVGVEPEALMLVAPMNNFREQASTVYQTSRENDWRVRWFVSEHRFSTALDRVIANGIENEEYLKLHPRLEAASSPMVIAASSADDVVDYEGLRAGLALKDEERDEFFPFPDYTDFLVTFEGLENKEAQLITVPHLPHFGMFMLLHPLRTPLQQWLSSHVELTFAPEPEYPKHSEGEAEALQ